jgi:hypothetical protein
VEANTFRRMVLELQSRFPRLGRQIEESMAVAIEGDIFQDAYQAQLGPESEIYLIPKIGRRTFPKPRLRGNHDPRRPRQIDPRSPPLLSP